MQVKMNINFLRIHLFTLFIFGKVKIGKENF